MGIGELVSRLAVQPNAELTSALPSIRPVEVEHMCRSTSVIVGWRLCLEPWLTCVRPQSNLCSARATASLGLFEDEWSR